MRASTGYTLLEVIATLVLIGVLAGLATPVLGAFVDRIRVDTALNELRGHFNYARMVAVRSGQRVEIRFVPDTRNSCLTDYRIVLLGAAEETVKRIELGRDARGLCLSQNLGATNPLILSSRGLPATVVNRTFTARRGTQADSMRLSILGRLYRFD